MNSLNSDQIQQFIEEGFVRLLEGARTMQPAGLKEHVLGELEGKLDDDASLVVLEVL